jgi:hypothetical protein
VTSFAYAAARHQPSEMCVFCRRDLYDVERAVTNGAGVFLCKDCAWLALQTMESATEPDAPVRALPFPALISGEVPDAAAVDAIVALFVGNVHVHKVKFLTGDLAAVRLHVRGGQVVDGVVRRDGDQWEMEPATRDMLAGFLDEMDHPHDDDAA